MLAIDSDCDRAGVAIKDETGEYRFLSITLSQNTAHS